MAHDSAKGGSALRFVGIDVGAAAIHCVVLDESRKVIDSGVRHADGSEVQKLTDGATLVAIDAPASPSTEPHKDDATLAPKFRPARCCEIALGRRHRVWVPWVTPPATAVAPGWMKVGFGLYAALTARGHDPIEVYPYAGFRALNGAPLPSKTTVAGVHGRVALLRRAGLVAEQMELWSHDALDAALAALIAAQAHEGTAKPVSCGHDSSAIWLPQADQPTP